MPTRDELSDALLRSHELFAGWRARAGDAARHRHVDSVVDGTSAYIDLAFAWG